MTTSNLPIVLYAVPFLAALLAAATGWYVRGAARALAATATAVTAGVAALLLARVMAEGTLMTPLGGWPPPLGIALVVDRLSALMAVLISGVAAVTVMGSGGHVRQELPGRQTLYYACVLLATAGLLGIALTGDLFNLFVHLEVVSLAAYALVAAGGRGAPRAAMAYLIIGTVGATLYLLGVGFLYSATGTLNMADTARLIGGAHPRLVAVGTLLIVAGLGIKMALFPLHRWMAAAYQLAPAGSAAFMAPLVTKVSAYALIRVLFWVHGEEALRSGLALDLLAWAGAAAIVAGGAMALAEPDLRRLLAYSSIGQMGIIMLGVGLANTAGMTGAVLHIASDALMKGVLFLAAGSALLRFGVTRVEDLNRLRGRTPWLGLAVTVAGLSLIGVPPLGGFYGKWYVLNGAIQEGRWVFVAALAVGSLATIGYVSRILERLYFAAPGTEQSPAPHGESLAVGACLALAACVVLLGLGNESVVRSLVWPALPEVGP